MTTHPVVRPTLRYLAAAGLAVATMVGVGGAATAQSAPNAVQYTSNNGEVRCSLIDVDGGTYVQCVSDAPATRANFPQCNPPAELIPGVRIATDGTTQVSCHNQGLDGQPRALQPGDTRSFGDKTVFADPFGGLAVWDSDSYRALAYAGTSTMQGFSVPVSLS